MQWDQLYYVGAEAKQSGQMQGQLAAAYIKEHPDVDRNHDGKIQYVILEGEMGHQDAIIRTESVAESLKEQGIALEKLSYQIANWNRVQAQNRMIQLIGQYNNRMEVVLANNDAMALGAMDAYEKLGYTETNRPVFFGIDGTKEGLEAVKDGTLAATVYNDKEGQQQWQTLHFRLLQRMKIIQSFAVLLPALLYHYIRLLQVFRLLPLQALLLSHLFQKIPAGLFPYTRAFHKHP